MLFRSKNGERYSAEAAYIEPIRHRSNLTILPQRKAIRILMDDRRAIGVEVEHDGRKEKIETSLTFKRARARFQLVNK
mgnify:CR=1 FL=1